MREFFIGSRRIADDTPPLVIAEVGSNHQGSLDQAKALILAARRADCDAVKFQKRDNKTLYPKWMYDQPYNSEHAYGPTYGLHREALEFGRDDYMRLQEYAMELGLIFFATAFDIPSADFLAELDVPCIKVASGDLLNWALQQHIVGLRIPMILSSGGHNGADVMATVYQLRQSSSSKSLALLQCTATYPAKPEHLNLRVIQSYYIYHDIVIGLSDHEGGIALAPVAYALGARIFEKHLSLDRRLKGSDQCFSIEPHEMWQMVHNLRATAAALGDGVKVAYPEEEPAMRKMKSISWRRDWICSISPASSSSSPAGLGSLGSSGSGH